MNHDAPLVCIAMPVRDRPTPQTLHALKHNSPRHVLLTEIGKPVDVARNALVERVLALDPLPAIVIMVDDDAFWLPGRLEALAGELALRPELAMLVGGFSLRLGNESAAARRIAGNDESALKPAPPGVPHANCTLDQVVPIEECGLHACAIRTSALAALGAAPFAVGDTLGEDYQFCKRLRKNGLRIACAPGFLFWHVDTSLGLAFAPGMLPCKIVGGNPRALEKRDVDALAGKPGVRVVQLWMPDGRRGARVEITIESQRTYGPAVDRIVAVA